MKTTYLILIFLLFSLILFSNHIDAFYFLISQIEIERKKHIHPYDTLYEQFSFSDSLLFIYFLTSVIVYLCKIAL